MKFYRYVRILQDHYRKSIGDARLCGTLFDFVILPANLHKSTDDNDYISVSSSTISKLLNGNAPIHTEIRDHIYDEKVVDQLVKNFNEVIVPELNPEVEDLCFQMMEIIRHEMIAPSSMADFEMLAKPETIAAFLAKTFVHAIVTNDSENIESYTQDSLQKDVSLGESLLSVKGIDNNKRLSEVIIEELFLSKIGISEEGLLNELRILYEEAMKIHLEKEIPPTNPWGLKLNLYEPYNIEKNDKEWIDVFAKNMEIELPDDFYDYGDLHIDPFGGFNSMGIPTRVENGSPEAKQKYNIINRIRDSISNFVRIYPYLEAFKDVKCISLAIQNSGTDYDQDVRITLHFCKENLLTSEEIALYDKKALAYLIKDCDIEKQFGISKGIDYLNYDESENFKPRSISLPDSDFPFLSKDEETDYVEKVKNLFGYFYAEDETGFIVEVTVDNINQHTAVAFPTVILIKDHIDDIPYTIKSKHQPEIISGKINVKPLSLNRKDHK